MFEVSGETLDNGNIKYIFKCIKCDKEQSYINILPPIFCKRCSSPLINVERVQNHKDLRSRLLYYAGFSVQ